MSNIIKLFKDDGKPILFELTNVYMTSGVQSLIAENVITDLDINIMLLKHMQNVDDNEHQEDIKANQEAINSGIGRVLSVYESKGSRLYINSYMEKVNGKAAASETMIMLCDEY